MGCDDDVFFFQLATLVIYILCIYIGILHTFSGVTVWTFIFLSTSTSRATSSSSELMLWIFWNMLVATPSAFMNICV